jgi:hypothetical protein
LWHLYLFGDLLFACLHANPDNELSGPPEEEKPKQASGN